MDFGLYLKDVSKKPSPSGAWLREGPKITKEDLKYGKNSIEHITFNEAACGAGERGPKPEYRGWTSASEGTYGQNAKPKKIERNDEGQGPQMGFGKYRTQPMKWVKSNDPQYWEWCLNNVGWFRSKVEKARL